MPRRGQGAIRVGETNAAALHNSLKGEDDGDLGLTGADQLSPERCFEEKRVAPGTKETDMKIFLAVLAALLTTACGGGGNDDDGEQEVAAVVASGNVIGIIPATGPTTSGPPIVGCTSNDFAVLVCVQTVSDLTPSIQSCEFIDAATCTFHVEHRPQADGDFWAITFCQDTNRDGVCAGEFITQPFSLELSTQTICGGDQYVVADANLGFGGGSGVTGSFSRTIDGCPGQPRVPPTT